MLNQLAMVVDLKALLVRKVLLVLPGQMDKTAKMELLVHKVLLDLLGQLALPELKVLQALREPMVLRVHKDLQAQEVVLTVGIQMVMAFKMPMKM
jgi:hypothetical protein